MPDRTRVVQIVNSLARAGAERATVDLACSLDPARFEVYVIVVRDGPLRDDLEAAGIPFTVVGGEFDHRAPLVVARITGELRRIRPDIVNTHMIGSDVVGRTAAMLAGVPVIVSTQHDSYPRRGVLAAFRRLTEGRVSVVVACSAAIVGYCMSDLGMPANRIEVIENAVDVDRMRSARISGGEFVFGAVGTLIDVKGHETAIRAFAGFAKRSARVRLAIAGDGPLRERLEELAREVGVAGSVEFLGQIDDVAGLLARIDAFVHPSLAEGLPLALLEAMAAPRPIIASDLPAIREALADGEAGLLVAPGDVDALAAAMERIHVGGDEIDRMTQVAGRRAEQRYSLARMAAQYADLYERLSAAREVGSDGL